MQQIGIYEQLITQLVASRLNSQKFYVGDRALEPAEASVWLSRFLSNILEYAIASIPTGDNQLQAQIELANQLLLWLKAQLNEVLSLLVNRIHHEQLRLEILALNPLKVHARYTRGQILAGFAATTFVYQKPAREGVLVIEEQNIELLFVTLNKNEKQFSPTTMYHDYAINERLFHWQSQNSARPDRGKGLSYIQHKQTGKRVFLFVREQAKDEYGNTMGFVNFGEVEYISHHGSQPMSITWQLKTPIPNFMWQQAAKLAIG
ncbi:DUF3427 domain-containing protein [Rheinheimera sp. WS51]|uniref:DUF3427 domain-containing protein n=1 Tax=Rheinheimera sp. WS51 TaxID=3425886 RepID=UPI003D8B3A57